MKPDAALRNITIDFQTTGSDWWLRNAVGPKRNNENIVIQ